MTNPTAAVILAAGQGTRMRTSLPKVLHPCADLPLVAHVVSLALARRCDPVVVVVDPKGQPVQAMLEALFPEAPLVFAVQEVARGTGDAVRAGLASIPSFAGRALVLYGDVPLLRAETVARLEDALRGVELAFLTARVDDPTGYGRVVRSGEAVARIVEHKDAGEAERVVREINVGVYLCDVALLRETVGGLTADNAQGELYLTDIVARAAKGGGARAVMVDDLDEVRGVNSQAELAEVSAIMRRRLIAEHQARGVRFLDPGTTFIGTRVQIEADVVIGVGVQLVGEVHIGCGVRIEGPTFIKDSRLAAGAQVESFCHLEGATVGEGAHVGPFARLRPEAQLDEGARIGNFVEVKNSRIGAGAKANHLAYLGDADVGPGVNIGAGTITCNYDGVHKHRTVIEKGVFVGSNSTLVAPLHLGAGAYVAAGSTLTKDVPDDALAFGRARQETREGYAQRLRELQAAKKQAAKKG